MAEKLVCGIDEAGRGPIAGPVFAAAVVLATDISLPGVVDSKLLSEHKRDRLAEIIRTRSLDWAVASASVEEIDRLNILQATFLAMRRAYDNLHVPPAEAWVDGNRDPGLPCTTTTIVGGDRLHLCISAASILAKSARDTEMRRLHLRYPIYGFDRHKGYPTREHLGLIRVHGVCEIYRKSFSPVRHILEQGAAHMTQRRPVPTDA